MGQKISRCFDRLETLKRAVHNHRADVDRGLRELGREIGERLVATEKENGPFRLISRARTSTAFPTPNPTPMNTNEDGAAAAAAVAESERPQRYAPFEQNFIIQSDGPYGKKPNFSKPDFTGKAQDLAKVLNNFLRLTFHKALDRKDVICNTLKKLGLDRYEEEPINDKDVSFIMKRDRKTIAKVFSCVKQSMNIPDSKGVNDRITISVTGDRIYTYAVKTQHFTRTKSAVEGVGKVFDNNYAIFCGDGCYFAVLPYKLDEIDIPKLTTGPIVAIYDAFLPPQSRPKRINGQPRPARGTAANFSGSPVASKLVDLRSPAPKTTNTQQTTSSNLSSSTSTSSSSSSSSTSSSLEMTDGESHAPIPETSNDEPNTVMEQANEAAPSTPVTTPRRNLKRSRRELDELAVGQRNLDRMMEGTKHHKDNNHSPHHDNYDGRTSRARSRATQFGTRSPPSS